MKWTKILKFIFLELPLGVLGDMLDGIGDILLLSSSSSDKDVLEKREKTKKIKELFNFFCWFLELLESNDYWENNDTTDEKINTILLRLNENKRELRKFFGIELLTEVQDEHEKKIIALFGKYFITFRTRVPYECFIGRRDDEENSFKLCAGYTQALDIKKLMFIDIYRRLNNVFDIRVRIVKELMRKGERKKKDNYL